MRDHLRSGTEVLDGLRGLAILLVVAYHTWLFSWYTPTLSVFGHDLPVDDIPRTGYLGVELFFAISGFVLFFPHAVRALTGAGHVHDVRQFALRRIAKIVPSYWVAVAFTVAAMASLHQHYDVVAEVARHLAFINDAYYNSMGYANSVFWSLAIEVQFYVVFPLIAWAFGRQPLLCALAMTVSAIAYRVHVAPCCAEIEPVFRRLPAFLDVFAAGMLAAYAVVWIRTRVHDHERFAFLFTGVTLACAVAWWTLIVSCNDVQYVKDGDHLWNVWHRTPLAYAVSGVMAFGSVSYAWLRKIIANPVLVFFSVISYNLYLWHALILIWLWKGNHLPFTGKDPHADDHWKALFIGTGVPLGIAISAALTYFLERPILSRISPQTFSFDWSRLRARPHPPQNAPEGTRT